MCGGCANEPVASYREGDVVRLQSPSHGVPDERIGRVGAWDPEFGLRVDWPRLRADGEGATDEAPPVWIPWAAFTCLDLAPTFRIRLVDDSLFLDEAPDQPSHYVTLGQGWLRSPVVLRAAPKRRRRPSPDWVEEFPRAPKRQVAPEVQSPHSAPGLRPALASPKTESLRK